jgi:hypothetical protein
MRFVADKLALAKICVKMSMSPVNPVLPETDSVACSPRVNYTD